MISVVKPGLLTTVQDAGRPGWRACGLPLAGAVDRLAWALANVLAANRPGAAALELTLRGGTFRFERAACAALAGADMGATLDGEPIPPWTAFPVRAGAELALGAASSGCRAYLAVHGGIAVPPVMGSRSTCLRASLGGLDGRVLRAGDRLPLGPPPGPPPGRHRLSARLTPGHPREVRLRALPGPQDDLFLPEALATLATAEYRVTNRNDRMGYRLEGAALRHRAGADIVSDAVCPGAVQVPGNGMPIVLLADAQTAGGYAKIAAVIGPDLGKLAQARAGDTVRFVPCSDAEAVEALRAERRLLEEAAGSLEAW